MLEPAGMVAAIVLGIGAAVSVVLLLLRLSGPARPLPQVQDQPCVFLFDGLTCIDQSEASRQITGLNREDPRGDWAMLRDRLDIRFPALPSDPEELPEGTSLLKPVGPRDPGQIEIRRDGSRVRLTVLGDPASGLEGAGLHLCQTALLEHAAMGQALSLTPNPIWQETGDGRIIWANPAYADLARRLGHVQPPDPGAFQPRVFAPLEPGTTSFALRRDQISGPGGDTPEWYDLCAVACGTRRIVFALNVDAVVRAEIAQRTFVQTLTKTFAQLSTGLAIFNRDRQLALFNPALLDLTGLPADFLSSRPTILSVFDRLRDNRLMPEPKNYATWRERVGTLVAAASDGRFHEVWTLPDGRTYRVTGRPHPDGAVAFLFEDITQEVSQARSFRSELELGSAVLDEMREAVAVFTSEGVLAFSNLPFRRLWQVDPDSAFADMTIHDAVAVWRETGPHDTLWPEVERCLGKSLAMSTTQFRLADGTCWTCRIQPLLGGARMVVFAPCLQERGASIPTKDGVSA